MVIVSTTSLESFSLRPEKFHKGFSFGGGNVPSDSKWLQAGKIIFELFSGALQENPVRAPGAITGEALTGQGPIQETIIGELFSGALQENHVIAPGQLHEKCLPNYFG